MSQLLECTLNMPLYRLNDHSYSDILTNSKKDATKTMYVDVWNACNLHISNDNVHMCFWYVLSSMMSKE